MTLIKPIVTGPELNISPATKAHNGINFGNTVSKIIKILKKTMNHENGVGIAAPQIGYHDCIMIMKTTEGDIALIDPEVLWESPELVPGFEGCLSFAGETVRNQRSEVIKVRYIHENLSTMVEKEFKFLEATIFQHEYEHLLGLNMYIQHYFKTYEMYKLFKNALASDAYKGTKSTLAFTVPDSTDTGSHHDITYQDGMYFCSPMSLRRMFAIYEDFRVETLVVFA